MKGIIDFQAERYREITSQIDEVAELIKAHGAPEGLEPEHCIVTYALNKLKEEIAAMEKQPEYEYTKVTESIFDLKDDFESLSLYWVNDCGSAMEYIKVYKNDFSMLAKQYESKNLYRRVEITPEQKREREVEELKLILFNSAPISQAQTFDESQICTKDAYKAMSQAAIEWMESKE